jgi:hypothetical protein
MWDEPSMRPLLTEPRFKRVRQCDLGDSGDLMLGAGRAARSVCLSSARDEGTGNGGNEVDGLLESMGFHEKEKNRAGRLERIPMPDVNSRGSRRLCTMDRSSCRHCTG